MSQPIKSGDECIVIRGLGQHKSPNIGLKVLVGGFRGEHSVHGRVWRCTGAGLKQLTDGGGYQELGWADIPAAWLQKCDPTPVKDTTEEKKGIEA